jgi:uncharacterized protein (TIGR02302 family)
MTAAPESTGRRSRRLEWRIALARLALLWEGLWPGVAPGAGIAALFAILALFEVWLWLPGIVHAIGLGLFAIAFLAALAWGLRRIATPDRAAGRRRLEVKSGLAHRPLAALDDRLAVDPADAGTQALWQAHRGRVLAALKGLRVGWPEAGWGRHDPLALRAGLVLLLIVAFAFAGRDAPDRLAAALKPDYSGGRAAALVSFNAWISPPDYTGLPPIVLSRDNAIGGAQAAPLRVPASSTLLAKLHGGRGTPKLVIDGDETPFETIDAANHQLSKAIGAGQRLALKQGGREVAAWRIDVVPDQLPQIRFKTPPKAGPRGALEIAYEAGDDYGLARVALELRRADSEEVVSLPLPLANPRARSASEVSYHDLTPHPWAGLAVRLRLVAEDAIGQVGSSEDVEFTLPEREFTHPVARAVIEQRRRLAVEPASRPRVAFALGALALIPEAYERDVVAHLGLSVARARLNHDRGDSAIATTQEILWETALRIEDGGLTQAERALRAAQRELMDALARNAPDEEIERLMQELKQALDRFMQALTEQALERARRGEQIPEADPNQRLLSSEDLQRLLDRARELARSGARDAARDLLAQLQQMLENLREGRLAQRPGQTGERGQALQELGDIMRRQQELLDRSFRRSQQGMQGQQSPGQRGRPQPGQRGQRGEPGDDEGDAASQEALRRRLGELMRRLGEGMGDIPGAFGRADQAMRDAREALSGGEPGQAVGPQGEALDQLRQGAQSMMQQLMEQMGQNGEQGLTSFGRPRGSFREDPLGRPFEGDWDDGDSTKVPDEGDLARSRQILEELQRRAGEWRRPQLERDYIDRLLRRF